MESDQTYKKIVYLTFPPDVSNKPVVCNLARLYDLCFNILKAQITPRQEGQMTIEISGDSRAFEQGMEYLKEHDIRVYPITQKISRDEQSCIHCGMCTALCPTRALAMDATTRLVVFDADRCSACGLCTTVCPVKAMEVFPENGHI
ncbi:MAG: 4Fe-4S binding protein [Desulfovibrio sp.]|nr:4Fe-4S binding protein [Desulfovibrio sp.]